MNLRRASIAAAACLGAAAAASAAAPSVEIANQAGPHGTAPREWLQRLAEAGAGPARLVAARGKERPRLVELGEGLGGRPMVKLYGVLTRDGELLLPGPTGPKRFGRSDRAALEEYFQRIAGDGPAALTEPRGKFGLTRAEFVDLFTRLQTPLPEWPQPPTLRRAIDDVSRAARVKIDVAPAAEAALGTTADAADEVRGLASGAGLAAMLRAEGLALQPRRPVGEGVRLVVAPAKEADDPWPVGYEPEVAIGEAAPVLSEFLTVEVEGYTLSEAIDAIRPRLEVNGEPLAIVYDHFALRRDGVDPAAVEVSFPKRRTFYKRLLGALANQAGLGVELRVDENGKPLLWLSR
ncbi:hypothetical protein [Botrimarina sp.]|uniref:hypothetical protein n=1 Tax=Botrimarina sp. TaxID=2795802 RepID=UPI0032EBBCE5